MAILNESHIEIGDLILYGDYDDNYGCYYIVLDTKNFILLSVEFLTVSSYIGNLNFVLICRPNLKDFSYD